MKEYICRLVDYEGFIVDGAFVTAKNKKEAIGLFAVQPPLAIAQAIIQV